MASNIKFLWSGKLLTKDELESDPGFKQIQHPVMVRGDIVPEPDVVYVFDSDDNFNKWAMTTKHADKITQINRTIAEVQKHQNEDHTEAIKRAQIVNQRVMDDLKALSAKTGLPLGSPELFLRASVQTPILEPPILRSALLFDDYDFKWDQQVFPANTVPYPVLGWYNFDHKASSMMFLGAGVASDQPWFWGAKFWFVGISIPLDSGPIQWDNLGTAGWDDRFSSFYISGP